MRQGDWKILTDNAITRFELYNVRNDIAEKRNLARTEPARLEREQQGDVRKDTCTGLDLASAARWGPFWL
jgi:arylsulfatase A-like enzyme